jgi:hypothetical protein
MTRSRDELLLEETSKENNWLPKQNVKFCKLIKCSSNIIALIMQLLDVIDKKLSGCFIIRSLLRQTKVIMEIGDILLLSDGFQCAEAASLVWKLALALDLFDTCLLAVHVCPFVRLSSGIHGIGNSPVYLIKLLK